MGSNLARRCHLGTAHAFEGEQMGFDLGFECGVLRLGRVAQHEVEADGIPRHFDVFDRFVADKTVSTVGV